MAVIPPLRVQDLAALECANPHCEGGDHPIYLNARCHPGAGHDLSYDKDKQAMIVECHDCKAVICYIAVAPAIVH